MSALDRINEQLFTEMTDIEFSIVVASWHLEGDALERVKRAAEELARYQAVERRISNLFAKWNIELTQPKDDAQANAQVPFGASYDILLKMCIKELAAALDGKK